MAIGRVVFIGDAETQKAGGDVPPAGAPFFARPDDEVECAKWTRYSAADQSSLSYRIQLASSERNKSQPLTISTRM